MVADGVLIEQRGDQTLFLRRDLALDPAPFLALLAEEKPGRTFQPNKGRFVLKAQPSDLGPLASKRFHYHRTYRRKQRLLMGYRWQTPHGPLQFIRALYAFRRGHLLAEPVLALRRPCGRIRQESLLVTRWAEGVSLREIFLDPERPMEAKLAFFRQGLLALKAMHDDGIAFGDAQSRHQIIDAEERMWWLDFDKMAIRGVGRGKRDRDLRRFTSSAVVRISQSGRDLPDASADVLATLRETYPLPGFWRRTLELEVKRRVERMLNRPGFQRP